MARTESLMGSGKLFDAAKPGQNGGPVRYQLQVTSPDEGVAGNEEWFGYIRLIVGAKLHGSKNNDPNPKVRYELLLEDNENRKGIVRIMQVVGKVGEFINYQIAGTDA